jgi:hypothetical protein
MTRPPFGHDKDDGLPAELESTLADLERYMADSDAEPPPGFVTRVMDVVESQPVPRRGVLAALTTAFTSDRGRVALMAATVAVAVMAVVATGQLARLLPGQSGGSPQPGQTAPASTEPSPPVTPSPSVSPSPSESPSAEPSASGSDDESDGSDASDDADESPTGSDDHSGPGVDGEDGDSSGASSGTSHSEAGV